MRTDTMAIPDYQTVMLPLLMYASDQQEHHFRDAVDSLADELKLSDEERKEMLPSGQSEIFRNRVGWARTYLKKAGLIESPKRGYLRITQRGRVVLSENPQRVDVSFLNKAKVSGPDF